MDEPADILAHDLCAAVGEIMLCWGFLEEAMLQALADTSPSKPARSIVGRWQETFDPKRELIGGIKRSRAIRHLLAHGLCGLKAQPGDGSEAHVICRKRNDKTEMISLSELRRAAQQLDDFRRRIPLIRLPASA